MTCLLRQLKANYHLIHIDSHPPQGDIDSLCRGDYKRPEASPCEGNPAILSSATPTFILYSQQVLPSPQISCSVFAS